MAGFAVVRAGPVAHAPQADSHVADLKARSSQRAIFHNSLNSLGAILDPVRHGLMLCFLKHVFVDQNRLAVTDHLAKKQLILNESFLSEALWELAGGASDSSILLIRPRWIDRTRLARPRSRMLRSLGRASMVEGRQEPLLSVQGQVFRGRLRPALFSADLKPNFHRDNDRKLTGRIQGCEAVDFTHLPVPIRATVAV